MDPVAAPDHLPRRYRLVLISLCLFCGGALGLWAATRSSVPYGDPVFVLSALIGMAGGLAAFRVLERSLERSAE